jgi:adenosine/AMP kinase
MNEKELIKNSIIAARAASVGSYHTVLAFAADYINVLNGNPPQMSAQDIRFLLEDNNSSIDVIFAATNAIGAVHGFSPEDLPSTDEIKQLAQEFLAEQERIKQEIEILEKMYKQ